MGNIVKHIWITIKDKLFIPRNKIEITQKQSVAKEIISKSKLLCVWFILIAIFSIKSFI